MSEHEPKPRTDGGAEAEPGPHPVCVESADLLGHAGVLVIQHGGDRYVLRRTRNGRLILTK